MTGKTMLGLVVLAIGLSTIPAFAESETTILSPYQQFKNGTPINEIQCKDSKILMESPRNTPACVNENSVEKLEDKGYIILYPLQTDFKDNSESSETTLLDNKIDMMISENANSSNDIQTKYIYTNDKSTGGHGYQGFTRTPLYSLEIPNSINVGETVSINYTLSWFNPDGTSILDGIIDEEERYDIVNTNVGIVIPDEFTVLNEDKTFFKTYADQYTPHTATWYEFNEGYSTELISGSIDVRLDKEMMYELDRFSVPLGGKPHFLVVQKTDDGIVLRELSSFTDKSDIYTISTMTSMTRGEENGRYDVLYLQDVPHIPEFRTAQQTFNEPQENLYIPREGWDTFSEFLNLQIQNYNITNVRSWLLAQNLTENFVDDFFAEYPEFTKTQTSNGFSNRVDPTPQLFIFGNYNIVSSSNNIPAENVEICAFDRNLTSNDSQILFYGGDEACTVTSSDGFFRIYVDNDDPDDSTFVDLVLVMSLQNENVKSIDFNTNMIISDTPPNTINNVSQPILNVNTLFAPRIYSIYYNDFTALNTAHTFFDDELNYDIPFVTLEENSDRTVYCRSVAQLI